MRGEEPSNFSVAILFPFPTLSCNIYTLHSTDLSNTSFWVRGLYWPCLLVKCTKMKPQVDCFSSCSAHVTSSVAKSDWQVSYFTLKFHISKIALHFNLLFAFLKLRGFFLHYNFCSLSGVGKCVGWPLPAGRGGGRGAVSHPQVRKSIAWGWGWRKGEEVGEEKHEGEEVGRRRGRKVVSNWRECRRCRELVISSWMFHYFQTTLPLPTKHPSDPWSVLPIWLLHITSMKSNPFMIFDDHLHPTDQVGVRWFQSLVFNHVAPCLALPTAHLPGGHKVHLKTSDFYFDLNNYFFWSKIRRLFPGADDLASSTWQLLARTTGEIFCFEVIFLKTRARIMIERYPNMICLNQEQWLWWAVP